MTREEIRAEAFREALAVIYEKIKQCDKELELKSHFNRGPWIAARSVARELADKIKGLK